MSVVVGTAGHIDHGKTALLRALTGIDADRLPEERARGMTIDVGYAHLTLADGSALDFVDVPGHDRLVGNMLVGAGEIDAAMLVVAADDGPRAQTREHLELLDALGIDVGLAVITKTDAVEPGRVAEVAAALRELLDSTSLAGLSVVAASSITGVGLDEVRAALEAVRDRVLGLGGAEPATTRLAIDRVFAVRGRGTVVTGTLRGAPIERGGILRVVPGAGDASVRIRELQVRNESVERAGPGRTAINVAVTGDVALERGVVLTTDPAVVATDRLLVSLGRGVPDRTPVMLHLGTARVPGFVAAGARDAIELGEGETSAIVRLDRPVAAAAGDRFVLRRPSPAGTLAGGRILDPSPPRGAARRRVTPERVRALAAVVAQEGAGAGWDAARLQIHGISPDGGALAADVAAALDDALTATVNDRRSIAAAELVRIGAAALRRVLGNVRVPQRTVTARIDALVARGRLVQRGGSVLPAGAEVDDIEPEIAAAMDRVVSLLSTASPPSIAEAAAAAGCPPDAVRRLERDGRIVRVDGDLGWSAATFAALTARALALAGEGPLTPAAYRDATGTSRRYVMAILEDLDRRAILRRTPAGHVPGPRAGTVPVPATTPP